MYTKQLITKIDASQGSSLNIATWFNFYSFDVMGDLAFGKGFEMLKDGVAHYFMELSHSGIKSVAAFSHLVWIFPLLKTVPVLNTQHLRFQAWLAERVRLRREVCLRVSHCSQEILNNPIAKTWSAWCFLLDISRLWANWKPHGTRYAQSARGRARHRCSWQVCYHCSSTQKQAKWAEYEVTRLRQASLVYFSS